MNTPEQTTNNNHLNENKQQKSQIPLIQNQFRPIQGRNYGRLLREYNKPAQWYQASYIKRSIYYYDPNYQKYLQQQSKSPTNIRLNHSPIRLPNQLKSHSKCTTNSHNYQQKSTLPSRLQSVPTLPPISTHKKSNEE